MDWERGRASVKEESDGYIGKLGVVRCRKSADEGRGVQGK